MRGSLVRGKVENIRETHGSLSLFLYEIKSFVLLKRLTPEVNHLGVFFFFSDLMKELGERGYLPLMEIYSP